MKADVLRKAALSGARWSIAARVGLQVFTWPITILVVRLLEPRDYGLFAIAMVIAGFVTLFSELGLSAALVQAEREVDEATARAASGAIFALNGLVALLLVVLAPLTADWFKEPELVPIMRTLPLDLVFASFAAVPQAMLERQLRFRQLSLSMMAGGAVGAVVTLTLAWLDFDVWALVGGYLAQSLVRSVMLIAFHGRLVWPALRGSLAPIVPMVRFSSHVLTVRVLWYWYGQADQAILARVQQASVLGYYSIAAQFAMLPASKAMEAINRVAFPILTRLRSDAAGLRETHPRLLALVAAYGFSICWLLAAVAEEFVPLVLGDKWQPASAALTLLALVAPLRMLCAMHNTIATAVGKPEAATKELALASVLVPGAVLAGAAWGGLHGAALAWVVAYPFVYLLSNALTSRAVGNRARDGLRPLAAPVLAGCVMMLAVSGVRLAFDDADDGWLAAQLAAELLAGAAAFLISLKLVAPELVRETRELLLDLLRPGRAAS